MHIFPGIPCLVLNAVLFGPTVNAQKINVSYNAASSENFSGKVFLYLSKENKEPRHGMVGMDKFPCFSISVKNIKPGQKVIFDDQAISYPVAISDIERGEYYTQAVWDRNTGGRSISNSPGNIYNIPVKLKITKN